MAHRNFDNEESLVLALRAGDEEAFAALLEDMNGRLLALARTFTTSPALVEEIVQETWLGVIRGLRGFEGRSTLRTWIFSILVRRARTMAVREARVSMRKTTSSSATNGLGSEWVPGGGKVGLWTEAPVSWDQVDPASMFQSMEALDVLRSALDSLPERQRQAVLLRDVEDLGSADICNILEITETNLRVLLHRGRARIRGALDRYVRDGTPPAPRPSRLRPALGSGHRAVPPSIRARGR